MKKIIYSIICLLIILSLSGCGCEHEWLDATCETPRTCALCGDIEGKANDHEWKEATFTEPAICNICGEESLFEHAESTINIMGTWDAVQYYSDGEIVDGNVTDMWARIVADGTGFFVHEGKQYNIQPYNRRYR